MSYKVLNIIKGNIYNLLNINEDLRASREDVACKNCFAASRNEKGEYLGWCSTAKNGCGCPVSSKSRVIDEVCPHKIWGNDWVNEDTLDKFNKENNYEPI